MQLGTGTTDLVLPGLDDAELGIVSEPQPGHWIERGPQKRLMVFAGRSHPALAQSIAEHQGVELGVIETFDFANGDLRPLRRVHSRPRHLPRADRVQPDRPQPDGAAADDPGGAARLGQADHGGHPALSYARR